MSDIMTPIAPMVARPYTPLDWYWRHEDGRVFASARAALVEPDDAAFAAWCGAGNFATQWPRDDDGVQTDAALQAVLTPYDVWFTARPASPAAPVITFKADLYRRCTDDEAERIDDALAAAPVRQRRLFETAQHLDHADPVFAAMRTAMVGLFGAPRADALLAPS